LKAGVAFGPQAYNDGIGVRSGLRLYETFTVSRRVTCVCIDPDHEAGICSVGPNRAVDGGSLDTLWILHHRHAIACRNYPANNGLSSIRTPAVRDDEIQIDASLFGQDVFDDAFYMSLFIEARDDHKHRRPDAF
jgi:hypothetical protein